MDTNNDTSSTINDNQTALATRESPGNRPILDQLEADLVFLIVDEQGCTMAILPYWEADQGLDVPALAARLGLQHAELFGSAVVVHIYDWR